MSEVKQYPDWQTEMRKAQAEAREAERLAEIERSNKIAEQDRKDAEKMRELLATLTLEMPEHIVVPKWVCDGYRFEYGFRDGHSYNSGRGYEPDTAFIYVFKGVVYSDTANIDDYDDDYLCEVSTKFEWSSRVFHKPTPGDLADALDELDKKAEDQIAINERVLKARENRLNEVKAPKKASLEDQLISYLRSLVEMMVNDYLDSEDVDAHHFEW